MSTDERKCQMFIWIIGILLIVGCVAFSIAQANDDFHEWKAGFALVLGVFALFYCPFVIASAVRVNPTIDEFVQQKEYIETHASDNEIEDAALTAKKVELNGWLYKAQYKLEHRHGWTLYPDSVLDLEPIE